MVVSAGGTLSEDDAMANAFDHDAPGWSQCLWIPFRGKQKWTEGLENFPLAVKVRCSRRQNGQIISVSRFLRA